MASDHLVATWTLIFGMLVAKGVTQSQTPVDRTAIEGDHVELRCDTAYDRTKDFYWSEAVIGIILYRPAGADVNNVTIPISRFRGRVSLVGLDSVNLRIDNVTMADEGSYNCQQKHADQQGTLQRLRVLEAVPPDPAAPTITGYSGGFLTPGSNVTLTCVSTGARPPANLTWWTGNTQLKARNSSTPDSTWQGDTRSEVTIPDLKLSDNGRVYQCRASHRALAQVETSQVTVSVAYPARRLSDGEIVGIAIGSVFGLFVVIGITASIAILSYKRYKRYKRKQGDTEMTKLSTGGGARDAKAGDESDEPSHTANDPKTQKEDKADGTSKPLLLQSTETDTTAPYRMRSLGRQRGEFSNQPIQQDSRSGANTTDPGSEEVELTILDDDINSED